MPASIFHPNPGEFLDQILTTTCANMFPNGLVSSTTDWQVGLSPETEAKRGTDGWPWKSTNGIPTLPETKLQRVSLHLKMDGWNSLDFLLGVCLFSGPGANC